jgi:hypothetical protein
MQNEKGIFNNGRLLQPPSIQTFDKFSRTENANSLAR